MSKKRKNWLEKFQEFWWDDLTPSQRRCLWVVLTAIRGPDHARSHGVKLSTTAKIRYLLLGNRMKKIKSIYQCFPYYGYLTKGIPHPVTPKRMQRFNTHFRDHTERAVCELRGVVEKNEMQDLIKLFKEDNNESNTKSQGS